MNTNIKDIMTIPTVIKRSSDGERGYDLLSRVLEDRIVFLNGEINADSAQIIVAELIYLASTDSNKDITMYINSPGGSVSDGFAIYDTMQYIKPDVRTICLGMAASMGAFLLSGGQHGKRYALPNAEVMIHQPLGGSQGQATEIEIAAKHILKTKHKLTSIMASNCGKPIEELIADMERDNWKSADEAKEYGLIDHVIEHAADAI